MRLQNFWAQVRWIFRREVIPIPEHQQRTTIPLRSLPIAPFVAWLEAFSVAIIDDVFTETPPDVAQFFDRERYPGVFADETTTLANALTHDSITAHTVRKALTFTEWRHFTIEKLMYDLVRNPKYRYNLPENMWQLCGVRAWQNPTFIFRMARYIERRLCERAMYMDGELPRVRLHPNTYWLLLAGVPCGDTPYTKRLTEIAQNIVMTASKDETWAGYWDQWVLLEAERQWNVSARWSNEIRTLILTLPLAFYGTDKPRPQEAHAFVLKDWERRSAQQTVKRRTPHPLAPSPSSGEGEHRK